MAPASVLRFSNSTTNVWTVCQPARICAGIVASTASLPREQFIEPCAQPKLKLPRLAATIVDSLNMLQFVGGAMPRSSSSPQIADRIAPLRSAIAEETSRTSVNVAASPSRSVAVNVYSAGAFTAVGVPDRVRVLALNTMPTGKVGDSVYVASPSPPLATGNCRATIDVSLIHVQPATVASPKDGCRSKDASGVAHALLLTSPAPSQFTARTWKTWNAPFARPTTLAVVVVGPLFGTAVQAPHTEPSR